MTILYTEKFAKEYKRLPDRIKDLAEIREDLFRKDPFDPRLRAHKLKGKLRKFYAFSISLQWRVIFHFKDKHSAIFDSVGTHEVYK